MAIIVATINTDADTISVTVNGSEVENVCDVTMCKIPDYDNDGDTCYVAIGTSAKDEEAGLVTRTYITRGGVSDKPPLVTDRSVAKAMRDIKKSFK